MEFRRQVLTSTLLHPAESFRPSTSSVEVRWDPLTGHSSRLVVAGGRLMPASGFDLAAFGRESESWCPFCAERIESSTPRFPPEFCESGRIGRGQAVLFPNLLTYSAHSSVSVYGPALHYLPLGEMTPRIVSDNLATQVEFGRAALRHDPEAGWQSINANHMLPSGSSLFHPHMQGSVDPVPTTFQRLLAEVPAARFDDYLAGERERGERYLGGDRVQWVASFAPSAPCELRAFVRGASSPVELDDDAVEELGRGIATALGLYSELGYESFNMAIYGAPPGTSGYPLNLRIACRSNLEPLYRSDATYFERLHWEGAVEMTPEQLADRARGRFGA